MHDPQAREAVRQRDDAPLLGGLLGGQLGDRLGSRRHSSELPELDWLQRPVLLRACR
ncbi:hypothetical protein [Mumia zhuanghuii]|uniref:hypothetical protein n=1 Tax=Mumia zhuanghuii TaxID=2585211 RepID=UPI00129C7A20|nr:hypothetical protein [Mumia zhuanghuii]